MRFVIEFYKHSYTTPDRSEIIRTHSGDFPSLDAARMYGLEHSGAPNTPDEADGFRVIENGSIRSEFVLRYPSR